jgi:hypothetical protein
VRLALTARQARELDRRYTDAANGGVQAFPGARAALARLRAAGVRLGVLTNGPADGQRRKLAVTGLDAAVDACFISEEIGVAKPDERAFRLALAGLGAEPGRSAMVGTASPPTSSRRCGSGCAACSWAPPTPRRAPSAPPRSRTCRTRSDSPPPARRGRVLS